MRISLQALPFCLTALGYAAVGLFMCLSGQSKLQRRYGIFCLVTCFWPTVWAILFSGFPIASDYRALEICYSAIVFIPPVLYQFIVELTQTESDQWLTPFYLMSSLLLFLIWTSRTVISGFNHFSWGLSARAGMLHPLFILLILSVIGAMFYRIRSLRRQDALSDLKKQQIFIVHVAVFFYCFGGFDLLSNYGISFFPISFVTSGLSVALFGFAIRRYELLSPHSMAESDEDYQRRLAASQEMKRLGASVAFPLVSQGEVLGCLFLGEKKSEEAYSKEDLLLLRIVANQAALACQRAKYFEMAINGARTEVLGQIAGGFAHEIKTPLANISLPAEMTLMDLNDVASGKVSLDKVLPEMRNRMKDIMTQVFKASEKIEAIRQFSKPGQIQLDAINVKEVIRSSIGLLEHSIRDTRTTILEDFPDVIPPVRGDAKQLEIVFVNLIKNAVEAMSSFGSPALAREIKIRGFEEGNSVVMSVKDTGPGIKQTHFGRLFEAYFTTKGSSGTGVGLFLSHQVIKAHGGAIEVKSEEGKGTEFIVRLPKFVVQERSVHQAA